MNITIIETFLIFNLGGFCNLYRTGSQCEHIPDLNIFKLISNKRLKEPILNLPYCRSKNKNLKTTLNQ